MHLPALNFRAEAGPAFFDRCPHAQAGLLKGLGAIDCWCVDENSAYNPRPVLLFGAVPEARGEQSRMLRSDAHLRASRVEFGSSNSSVGLAHELSA